MTDLYINGKFLRQRTTGVQRVACEIVSALDQRIEAGEATPRCVLLMPAGAVAPALRHVEARTVGGPGPLHLWEQLALPRAARGELLVNLCGAAPALPLGPQACMLHDAAVFDHPEAYSRAFVHWYRWSFRRQARLGSRLLTVSAFSQARLAQALGVAMPRIAIVPPGADHLDATAPDAALLRAHGLDRRPFLLAVGSANPTKNLAALVRAWAAVNRADASLVIAGGGNAQVFAGGGLPQQSGVVALGPVGDAALKALYGAATGLVFPSLYEGFGLPPLEAMAHGCPVAAACAASLPEACGDAALWFDPHDDAAMAAAMRRLLDDAAERDRLRALGRLQAARYRWRDTAAALLRALEISA